MAHAAQGRVHEAINSLVQDLDKDHLRKIQGDMHRCAAKCCDKPNARLEDTHECITQCSEEIGRAQSYVQQELSHFQQRLARCALQCQDTIKDKLGSDMSEARMESMKGPFEDCIVQCVDSHVDLIPKMKKRMYSVVRDGTYSSANIA